MGAAEFIAAARAKIGRVTWRHRGRKPWALDCIGLVVVAAQEVGFEVNDPKGYGREPWEDRLSKGLRAHFGDPVAGPMQPGDVVTFRWVPGDPQHVGIVGDHPDGGLTLIHCQQEAGVVEHSLKGLILEKIVDIYRPRYC